MSSRDSNSGGTFSQHHATVAAANVAIMSLDTRTHIIINQKLLITVAYSNNVINKIVKQTFGNIC